MPEQENKDNQQTREKIEKGQENRNQIDLDKGSTPVKGGDLK